MPHLSIQMLGAFHVTVDGQLVDPSAWRLRTAGLLVKALALAPHYRLHREQLMEMLWPDADPDAASTNLRYTLHTARRALVSSGGETSEFLVRERDMLVLGRTHSVETDVEVFEDAVASAWRSASARAFREAVARYTGDLLPDDSNADWIADRRETLRTSYLAVCHRLADVERTGRASRATAPNESGAATPNNLPALLTQVIGREREVAEVRQLLASHRLVTLTGPGGVGKTRLAEVVGRASLDAFPDGVWFVSLAPLRDADVMLPSIARLLGIREAAEASLLETLAAHLEDKRVLLIVDNVEHLLDVAPLIADLLRRCPALHVLATSRIRLQQADERVFQVSPLDLPPENLPTSSAVTTFATVRLFAERAREVEPGFTVTDETASSVATICRRLDGLPLAIELAAARIDEFSPSHMANQLIRRLSLLADGPRDLPTRQQTLWSTIAWSYDLLTPDAQQLFRQLSVFVGGWTLEAAVAITGHVDESIVLRGLERLIEHNLIQVREQDDGDVRFSILETIREYSLDRLEAHGEAGEVFQRHAQYFLALVDRAEPELRGPQQQVWVERLESEHDNLRAAMHWPGNDALPDASLRIAGGLWQFWMARGYVSEGRLRMSKALATGTTVPSIVRAKAFDGAGVMAIAQGDYAEAKSLLEESLAISRAIGNQYLVARALHHLGIHALHLGDHGDASAHLDEAFVLFRDLGDLPGVSSIRHLQGELLAEQGDYQQAQRFADESLALWRTLGDRNGMSTSLDNLATLAYIRGDYERATLLAAESLELARGLGLKRVVANSLLTSADIALAQRDTALASRHYIEGLTLAREIGDRAVMISCLDGLACLAIAKGMMVDAARLFGSVDAVSNALGIPRPVHDQHRYEHHLAVLCTHLGKVGYETAMDAGRTLSLEEAFAAVLQASE